MKDQQSLRMAQRKRHEVPLAAAAGDQSKLCSARSLTERKAGAYTASVGNGQR
jgi:hypothetical protein